MEWLPDSDERWRWATRRMVGGGRPRDAGPRRAARVLDLRYGRLWIFRAGGFELGLVVVAIEGVVGSCLW